MHTRNKIVAKEQAAKIVKNQKERGGKVVFSNGCFDIVHLGHIDYLEKSRALGDFLVLGLNSDDSVKKIKGASRPIADEKSRSHVMAAFEFIDLVVLFEEDTPFELIKYLKPDILVKGNDYNIDNIVGADIVIENGGKVETIELVKGYSTSSIIDKIKNSE